MIQTLTVYRNWKSAYSQQTILKDCNRYGSKQFKCSNGLVLAVDLWEWAK